LDFRPASARQQHRYDSGDPLIAPACVLDCSREAAADADFLLTVDFLRKWERRHDRIPPGSWT